MNIKVTNIDGKVVYSKPLDSSNVIQELDLSDYASGVYFIQVYNDKISKTERIILE